MNHTTILLATGNSGKVLEFQLALGKHFHIISSRDVGFQGDIVEDGDTFEANAHIKALALHDYARIHNPDVWVLADDSGICVDALDGRPGIHSARFARQGATAAENNSKLLAELTGTTQRAGHFVCVLHLISPSGEEKSFRGECHGKILDSGVGTEGFGYDPLFIPDGYVDTFATMSAETKDAISHRGKAVADFLSWWNRK